MYETQHTDVTCPSTHARLKPTTSVDAMGRETGVGLMGHLAGGVERTFFSEAVVSI
jgi:hypothetical protein